MATLQVYLADGGPQEGLALAARDWANKKRLNAGHQALVDLERAGTSTRWSPRTSTGSIRRRAATPRGSWIHGTLEEVQCLDCGRGRR